jgi:His-Xaa-Ser system radical SAM maturase HxsC
MNSPLTGALSHEGWSRSQLVKVAGVAEFASGAYPLERMVLDLRESPGLSESTALTALPWAGFLVHAGQDHPADRPWFATNLTVGPGDVIEISPRSNQAAIRYRRGAKGNILFATERCNSYCVMCSQPPREVNDRWRVNHLLDLIELIDRDASLLTLTGGEPTLLGDDLNQIIERCAKVLPNTAVQVLSNGRNFAEPGLAASFEEKHPDLIWCVPLYADHSQLHDYVVQRNGAFAETIKGLYALASSNQRIELRVVLVKPVVERLPALVRYIYQNLQFVEHVALMGTEPTGFAKGHYKDLWIDPVDMGDALSEAVRFLKRRAMRVSIYNLPLCALPENLRPFARRSISDWKQTLLPACEPCAAKTSCSGFFSSTTSKWTSRAIQPIGTEEETCASL